MVLSKQRIELAHKIIEILKENESVQDAYIRGSIINGNYDYFSDIDIGVDVSGFDNGKFASNLPDFLKENIDIIFFDWSPSLLPHDYVISFAHRGFPIYWFIDIQVVATPHIDSLREVPVNRYHHLLKLWILHLKYYLRENEESEKNILKLASGVLKNNFEDKSSLYIMDKIIKEIKNNIEPDLYSFVLKCEAELTKNFRKN